MIKNDATRSSIYFIFLASIAFLCLGISPALAAPIIIDHTSVDEADDIPDYYMNLIKTRRVNFPGESHSAAYREGPRLLMIQFSTYPVIISANTATGPVPHDPLHPALRIDGLLKDLQNNWNSGSGEAKWYTWYAVAQANNQDPATVSSEIKYSIEYSNTQNIGMRGIGFGWCWDMERTPSVTTPNELDPVFNVHWAGSSVGGPDGDRRWGLDDADFGVTGNRVSLQTYLRATKLYDDFAKSRGFSTRAIFTTGSIDSYAANESGYQRYLKHEYLRNYVQSSDDLVLFDYADILSYNNANQLYQNPTGWAGHVYPSIHPDNMRDYPVDSDPYQVSAPGSGSVGHIGEVGAVRLAKAIWVLMAKLEGWTGPGGTNSPPTVSAGSDRTITYPTTSVTLNATVTDDNFSGRPLTTQWIQISGPSQVRFTQASVVDTTVDVTAPGVYVLQLEATDTEFTRTDTMTLTLNPTASIFPLRVGTTRRYLEDKNGEPFLLHGDAGWGMVTHISLNNARAYLDNRKAKGFNTVLIELIDTYYQSMSETFRQNPSLYPPENANGDLPFTAVLPNETLNPGSYYFPYDFTTPNEAYFRHADQVLNLANERGMSVLVCPLYLGYSARDGWGEEAIDNGPARCQVYGEYLGERYKNTPNIIWTMGGDRNPSTGELDCLDKLAIGIQSRDTDAVFTAHALQDEAVDRFDKSWLHLNNVYTYADDIYTRIMNEYNYTRTIPGLEGTHMPVFLMEAEYEGEHGTTTSEIRRQAFHSYLSGGVGYIFGNSPIWYFGSGWIAAMDQPGSQAMVHVKKLMDSRRWPRLVPDQTHTVVTAGYGSGPTYVATARTDDGKTIMAYIPTGAPITLDMSKISAAQAKGYWYNPRDNSNTLIGTLAAAGSRDFTPPSSEDWVLVLDDATAGFPPPGGGVVINSPPQVNAGPDRIMTLPVNTATLSGSASDPDGDPLTINWTQIPTPTAGVTIVSPHTVTTNVTFTQPGTYSFRLTANDAQISRSDDVQVIVNPEPDTTPPVLSGIHADGISTQGATLLWTTNEVATSQVEYGPTSSYGQWSSLDATRVTAHSVTLSGLTSGTVYHYRIHSRDAANNLATSLDFQFATLVSPPVDTTPPVFSNIRVENLTETGALIRWTTDDASNSRVDFGPTTSYGLNRSDSVLTTNHTINLTGLVRGSLYHFRVTSVNEVGLAATSGDFTFSTLSDTTDPVITQVRATDITANSAVIRWTTDDPSTGLVQFGLFDPSENVSPTDSRFVTSHIITLSNLLPDRTYQYRVQSQNEAGGLSYSSVLTFRTGPNASGEPLPPAVDMRLDRNVLKPLQGDILQIDLLVDPSATANVTVHDRKGQPIIQLWDGLCSLCSNTVYWDGKKSDQSLVASGLYIILLVTDQGSINKKVVVVK